MSSSISLQQSVLKEIASLLDNDDALKKVLALARRLKRESKKEETDEFTEADKKEILDDLREAFKELKLAKEGKVKLQNARDFLNEVRSQSC